MRIIAGKWRGRALQAPTGAGTRPTADRVRETLFSMLHSRLGDLEGLAVLDLYAGTGALGLEALSRGAAEAWFIESDKAAVAALKSNIAKLGAGEVTHVIPGRADLLGKPPRRFHLVFLDPPYGQELAEKTLAALQDGWLEDSAWLSVETARSETLVAEGYAVDTLRDVGKARLHLLRKA